MLTIVLRYGEKRFPCTFVCKQLPGTKYATHAMQSGGRRQVCLAPETLCPIDWTDVLLLALLMPCNMAAKMRVQHNT